MTRGYVAVVGPTEASEREVALAEELAEVLAGAGATIVTGGRGGVMAAAARGARSAGGTSIGLLPGMDRSQGDSGHTFLLPTGIGELRCGLVVRAADVVVAVGGSWGTASEVAIASRAGTPVYLLEAWPVHGEGPVVVDTVEEAARRALSHLRG
jgi:uncharacterized protein (TIGR00725 family)